MIINYEDILSKWEEQKPIRAGKTYWLAIAESIEKQIARKPFREVECPRCRINIEDLLHSPYCYCNKCGQKIDKSKINH